MGFQKCPICNGSGKDKINEKLIVSCTVCNGKRIIHEETGLPPSGTFPLNIPTITPFTPTMPNVLPDPLPNTAPYVPYNRFSVTCTTDPCTSCLCDISNKEEKENKKCTLKDKGF